MYCWDINVMKRERRNERFHVSCVPLQSTCRLPIWVACLLCCFVLLCCCPIWKLYSMCLCDLHVCQCCTAFVYCLAQEDILDLQLQRNLEYLDEQVDTHTHTHTHNCCGKSAVQWSTHQWRKCSGAFEILCWNIYWSLAKEKIIIYRYNNCAWCPLIFRSLLSCSNNLDPTDNLIYGSASS